MLRQLRTVICPERFIKHQRQAGGIMRTVIDFNRLMNRRRQGTMRTLIYPECLVNRRRQPGRGLVRTLIYPKWLIGMLFIAAKYVTTCGVSFSIRAVSFSEVLLASGRDFKFLRKRFEDDDPWSTPKSRWVGYRFRGCQIMQNELALNSPFNIAIEAVSLAGEATLAVMLIRVALMNKISASEGGSQLC